jgi:hypothetical protein
MGFRYGGLATATMRKTGPVDHSLSLEALPTVHLRSRRFLSQMPPHPVLSAACEVLGIATPADLDGGHHFFEPGTS